MFVLDASIAACWAFDDEDHPIAARALDPHGRSDRPERWFEVRNTLLMGERRGWLAEPALFLRELARFGVRLDPTPEEASVLALARQYRLTVYDVSTRELAQREAIPLATLDAALQKAATALGVEALGAAREQ